MRFGHTTRFGGLLSCLIGLAIAASARAQTSYPMIDSMNPVAAQRGTTSEITIGTRRSNLYGAYKILFQGEGVSGEVVPAKKAAKAPTTIPNVRSVKIKVTVAPNAQLGVREFRIVSTLGVSSVGQLVIVADPVVKESKKNDTKEDAQEIKLPSVFTGRLEKPQDLDYVRFEAKKGETLTFEMYCARLQDKIHDLQKHAKPMMSLFNNEGRELAANDHFFFADPLISYTIPKDGTYYLQIRESTYDNEPRWVYAVKATNKPYISHIYPCAGNPGQTIEVEPVGSAGLLQKKVRFQVPSEPGLHRVQLDINGTKTNPATFVVDTLPQAIEQEPNDEAGKATRITLPAGINGRIGKTRDLDYFVFHAKKGKSIFFELKARRFGTKYNSTLHGLLEIIDAKGRTLVSGNQTHSTTEASLTFTPRADGDYFLRVRDLNSKGGPTAVYHVEADFARPDFALRCDGDKAMIGPGSSAAWFVHVTRQHGFKDAVEVVVEGLPKGFTASPLTIHPSMTQGLVVVTAAKDAAPKTIANVRIIGKAKLKSADGKEETLLREAAIEQEIYSPGGGRATFDVNMQTVAVTRPSDVMKVNVTPNKITLKPGQSAKIEVTIDRRADYKKRVSLDIPLKHLNRVYGNPLPPGVTIVAGQSKTALGTGNKGHIVIKAAPNAAPIENVPISVLAHVSINFVVKVSYSSEPILVTVVGKK